MPLSFSTLRTSLFLLFRHWLDLLRESALGSTALRHPGAAFCNSRSITDSAKQLAKAGGAVLIHHTELASIDDIVFGSDENA